MVEYISDLRLFLTISRTLNFREAGERLGYSPAVVSSRMQRLEAMTGKTLFIRSTRQIKLTEEGHQLVQYAEQLVDLSEQISRPKNGVLNRTSLKGGVRITAPHSFARLYLIEPLKCLLESHPEISIDLLLDDSVTKMVEEEIDISFRVGGETEPHTDSYDLFADDRILIASPQYLEKHGIPSTHSDLVNHQCLTYSNNKHWNLHCDEKVYRVTLPSMMSCNTADFLAQMCIAGAGIASKSKWSVQAELDNGKLVRVLPKYNVATAQRVRAILPKRDYVPARVTYVLETIQNYIIGNN